MKIDNHQLLEGLQNIHHGIEIECMKLHYDQVQIGTEMSVWVPGILHNIFDISYSIFSLHSL